jgi:hypothetical protein
MADKRRFLISIHKFFSFFGIQLHDLFRNITGIFWYLKDFVNLYYQQKQSAFFKIKSVYPVLTDKFDGAGVMRGHYFHMDLVVAQEIFHNNPDRHIDIGSRIDGFVAHVASFRKLTIIDIRTIESKIENIQFVKADLMANLPSDLINCTSSLSCLHALEHFGLGRYGDPIEINGHIQGFLNMSKILKKNGLFYFAVPISNKQRIVFNAHRVFSINYLCKNLFKDIFHIENFYYVDDLGNLNKPPFDLLNDEFLRSYDCHYGCGIFVLRKLKD